MVELFLERYHYHRPHMGLKMRTPLRKEDECRISTRIKCLLDNTKQHLKNLFCLNPEISGAHNIVFLTPGELSGNVNAVGGKIG